MNIKMLILPLLLATTMSIHPQDQAVKSSAVEYLATAIEEYGLDTAMNMLGPHF